MGTRKLELTPGTGPIKPRNGVQTSYTAGRASSKGRLTEDTAEDRGLLYWDRDWASLREKVSLGTEFAKWAQLCRGGKEQKMVRRSCPGQGTGFLARWCT